MGRAQAPARGKFGGIVLDYPRSNLLQYAYLYRDWWWSVIPVYLKKPAARWKPFQARPPHTPELHDLFTKPSRIDGLAVIPGPVSGGLCVRDFDQVGAYHRWAADRPGLARRCPTARTGRGYHVFFRVPRGYGPVYRKFEDGELIGDGRHYVVLPPSAHPSGKSYEWVNEPVDRSEFPVLDPVRAGFLTEPQQEKTNKTEDLPSEPLSKATKKNLKSSVTRVVVRACGELAERDLVARCLPSGPGERNDCLWRLARSLKALPHLTDADDAALWPFVEVWYQAAIPVIRTKSLKLCWADFRRQWKAARVPLGEGFDRAVREAASGPAPPEAARYVEGPARRLLAVCVALQKYAGDGPFFLSCRTAARVCGFGSHMTASRRLAELVEDGLLEVVEPGLGGTTRRRATRYRWVAVLN